MPKSKNRKNHKKKVAARNSRANVEKNKLKKFQDAFYQQMMSEVDAGAFEEGNVLEMPNDDDEVTKEASDEEASDEEASDNKPKCDESE